MILRPRARSIVALGVLLGLAALAPPRALALGGGALGRVASRLLGRGALGRAGSRVAAWSAAARLSVKSALRRGSTTAVARGTEGRMVSTSVAGASTRRAAGLGKAARDLSRTQRVAHLISGQVFPAASAPVTAAHPALWAPVGVLGQGP